MVNSDGRALPLLHQELARWQWRPKRARTGGRAQAAVLPRPTPDRRTFGSREGRRASPNHRGRRNNRGCRSPAGLCGRHRWIRPPIHLPERVQAVTAERFGSGGGLSRCENAHRGLVRAGNGQRKGRTGQAAPIRCRSDGGSSHAIAAPAGNARPERWLPVIIQPSRDVQCTVQLLSRLR